MKVLRPEEHMRRDNVTACLSSIYEGISQQSTSMTENACQKLGRIVRDVAQELSSSLFSQFMKGLLEQVLQMLQDTEDDHRQAGVLAIDSLIDVVAEENRRLLLNFAGHLNYVSKQPSLTTELLHCYTKTLGHLVLAGGSVMAPVVEDVSHQAILILNDQSSSSSQLLMAVLVVKSLVLNAQDQFLPQLKVLLSATHVQNDTPAPIVCALEYKDDAVRRGAEESFSACLTLSAKLEVSERGRWYRDFFDLANAGFTSRENRKLHGSLLIISALLGPNLQFFERNSRKTKTESKKKKVGKSVKKKKSENQNVSVKIVTGENGEALNYWEDEFQPNIDKYQCEANDDDGDDDDDDDGDIEFGNESDNFWKKKKPIFDSASSLHRADFLQYLGNDFPSLCRVILKFLKPKLYIPIRYTTIQLVPKLAACHPKQFLDSHFDECLNQLIHFVETSKNVEEKVLSLDSIGLLVLVDGVSEHLLNNSGKIVQIQLMLESALSAGKKKGSSKNSDVDVIARALKCIERLCRALKEDLGPYMHGTVPSATSFNSAGFIPDESSNNNSDGNNLDPYESQICEQGETVKNKNEMESAISPSHQRSLSRSDTKHDFNNSRGLLVAMLDSGLSDALVNALRIVVEEIPALNVLVQEALLRYMSEILAGVSITFDKPEKEKVRKKKKGGKYHRVQKRNNRLRRSSRYGSHRRMNSGGSHSNNQYSSSGDLSHVQEAFSSNSSPDKIARNRVNSGNSVQSNMSGSPGTNDETTDNNLKKKSTNTTSSSSGYWASRRVRTTSTTLQDLLNLTPFASSPMLSASARALSLGSSTTLDKEEQNELYALALRTLGGFRFSREILRRLSGGGLFRQLFWKRLAQFLESDNEEVRKAAAITSAALLQRVAPLVDEAKEEDYNYRVVEEERKHQNAETIQKGLEESFLPSKNLNEKSGNVGGDIGININSPLISNNATPELIKVSSIKEVPELELSPTKEKTLKKGDHVDVWSREKEAWLPGIVRKVEGDEINVRYGNNRTKWIVAQNNSLVKKSDKKQRRLKKKKSSSEKKKKVLSELLPQSPSLQLSPAFSLRSRGESVITLSSQLSPRSDCAGTPDHSEFESLSYQLGNLKDVDELEAPEDNVEVPLHHFSIDDETAKNKPKSADIQNEMWPREAQDMLVRLLDIALTDSKDSIRIVALQSLHKVLDFQLSHPRLLRALCVALNDENVTVRKAAVTILGRLAKLQPMIVIPEVNAALAQLLDELQHRGDVIHYLDASDLLSHMIRVVPTVARLNKDFITAVIIPILQHPEQHAASVFSKTLEIVAELAQTVRIALKPEIHFFINISINAILSNRPPHVQTKALRALSALVRSSGDVECADKYPALLPKIVSIISDRAGSKNENLRMEAMRLLGVLGAIAPKEFKQLKSQIQNTNDDSPTSSHSRKVNEKSSNKLWSWRHGEMRSLTTELDIACVVSSALMDTLLTNASMSLQQAVQSVQAITFIVRNLGPQCGALLGCVVPGIFHILRIDGKSSNSLKEERNLNPVKTRTLVLEKMGGLTSKKSKSGRIHFYRSSLLMTNALFNCLGVIVSCAGNEILLQNFVTDILGLLAERWALEMTSSFGKTSDNYNYFTINRGLNFSNEGYSYATNTSSRRGNESILDKTLSLAEDLAVTLGQRLSPFLNDLLPPLLQSLRKDVTALSVDADGANSYAKLEELNSEEKNSKQMSYLQNKINRISRKLRALPVICAFSMSSTTRQQFVVLVISTIVAVVERSELPELLRVDAVIALARLNASFDLSFCGARIMHPLCRSLRLVNPSSHPILWGHLLYTLRCVVQCIGHNYVGAVGMLRRVMAFIIRKQIKPWKLERLVTAASESQSEGFDDGMYGFALPDDIAARMRWRRDSSISDRHRYVSEGKRASELLRAWQSHPTSSNSTNAEWGNWYMRLALKQLELSPSASLWIVHTLAEVVQALAQRLFVPSFSIFWDSIQDVRVKQRVNTEIQRLVGKAAEEKLRVPPHVLQYVLSIFEFMERENLTDPRANRVRRRAKLKRRKNLNSNEKKNIQEFNLLTLKQSVDDSNGSTSNLSGGSSAAAAAAGGGGGEGDSGTAHQVDTLLLDTSSTRKNSNSSKEFDLNLNRKPLSVEKLNRKSVEKNEMQQLDTWSLHTFKAVARMCKARATTLYCCEKQFRALKTPALGDEASLWQVQKLVGQLVAVNMQLGLHAAAKGALHAAFELIPSLRESDVKNQWLETLGQWAVVLESIGKKQKQNDTCDKEEIRIYQEKQFVLKQIECFDKLRNWDLLFRKATSNWSNFGEEEKKTVAPRLARAGLELRKWKWVRTCIDVMPDRKGFVKSLFQLCLIAQQLDIDFVKKKFLKKNEFFDTSKNFKNLSKQILKNSKKKANFPIWMKQLKKAKRLISQARREVDNELVPLLQDGYGSAYMHVLMLQQLAELEELFELKRLQWTNEDAEAEQFRSSIDRMWKHRIKRSKYDVETWQRLLVVRTLLNGDRKDSMEWVWIKFAGICRRQDRMHLSEHVLRKLMEKNNVNSDQSYLEISGAVQFAWAKHLWKAGKHNEAIKCMRLLLKEGSRNESKSVLHNTDKESPRICLSNVDVNLRVRGHLKMSEWILDAIPLDRSKANRGNVEISTTLFNLNIFDENEALKNFDFVEDSTNILGNILESSRKEGKNNGEASLQSSILIGREVLRHVQCAIDLDDSSAKAWSAYALAHFRMAQHQQRLRGGLRSYSSAGTAVVSSSDSYRSSTGKDDDSVETNTSGIIIGRVGLTRVNSASSTASIEWEHEIVLHHVCPAIKGFFRSIALGAKKNVGNDKNTKSVLQKLIRLLTLWFAHGDNAVAHSEFVEGSTSIPDATWLSVIPQLLARIDSVGEGDMGIFLRELLVRVGKSHPQALIFPLTVACKSPLDSRKNAASVVLQTVRRSCPLLTQEALLVSDELIRVAILWHEGWKRAIEEASELYFGNANDIDAALEVLMTMHEKMALGGSTASEVAFLQRFGSPLQEAYRLLCRYINYDHLVENRSTNTSENANQMKECFLNQAWTIYYKIFHVINNEMIKHVKQVELQCASPRLLAARNLSLAMPGTYEAGSELVKIDSFGDTLEVIISSRRPRKISILASNGSTFHFLLKGNEDLRQDERVMQLFGLVNELLANVQQNIGGELLRIERYAVIPLSTTTGVVGWVASCDTLQQLVRNFRRKWHVPVHIEMQLMRQFSPQQLSNKRWDETYDNLTLLQKLETFEYALHNTSGQDLRKVMWLNCVDSEAWLDKRTEFTRSLAVMSMVGYILGLGDRHPSNIMIHRVTGKLVHIDFGDCWETAQQRSKYPEKIPFRLTRMLINAMEVSGIEGTFRTMSEFVMRKLRDNRDSVMAMLEAFVHDPLISWRLVESDQNPIVKINGKSGKRKSVDENKMESVKDLKGSSSSLVEIDVGMEKNENGEKIGIQDDDARTLAGAIVEASENEIAEGLGVPKLRHRHSTCRKSKHSEGSSPSASFSKMEKNRKDCDEYVSDKNGLSNVRLNQQAVRVIRRVKDKLVGRDFRTFTRNSRKEKESSEEEENLDVELQVDRLIRQATSNENLCQSYVGWCPFW
eukprot:g707.t1